MSDGAKVLAWMYVHPSQYTEFEQHRHGSGQPTDADRLDGWVGIPLCDANAATAREAELVAQVEALRSVSLPIVQHFTELRGYDDRNAPGHGHQVPGIWDDDNAPGIAGTECEWCKQWAGFRAALEAKP